MPPKKVAIADFLTREEIEQAWKLYKKWNGSGQFAREVDETIITPHIDRIDAALGRANDPRFLAYLVEYTFLRYGRAVVSNGGEHKP